MSYNGSGVYTLPGAALANGEIVSATENNQFRNDVAAALNVAWTRDGQAPATANIPMGSHKLTGLAAGTGNGDSVRYEQLPSASNLTPVSFGGTGSGTASGARTNLGLVIGTDVQAYSAELQGATQGGINGMKNRIINGAMMIDQRNAGASGSTQNAFSVDRWQMVASVASKYTYQQNAGSVTPPSGFTNYLGVTSSSSYSVGASENFYLQQQIEGFNFADLAWGSANAASVTLSFWVRSSLTGTFGGSLRNSANDRSYPFSYSIISANTWEQKSITIAGDTTGTWLTTNGTGVKVGFSIGTGSTYLGSAGSWGSTLYLGVTGQQNVVGTNGATFYITGVQLEKGSTATSFDYRPYGTELALCQRYYEVFGMGYSAWAISATDLRFGGAYKVTKRATPTLSVIGTQTIEYMGVYQKTSTNTTITAYDSDSTGTANTNIGGYTGLTNPAYHMVGASSYAASAEL